MKKLLFLGGAPSQALVIEEVKKTSTNEHK